MLRDDDFVVCGSNDAELRTWKLSKTNEDEADIKMSELLTSEVLLNFAVSIFFNSDLLKIFEKNTYILFKNVLKNKKGKIYIFNF